MVDAYMLGVDLAKRSFRVYVTDRADSVLYNRAMSRAKLESLLRDTKCVPRESLPPDLLIFIQADKIY